MKQLITTLLLALAAAPALHAATWTLYETARDTDHRLAQIPLRPLSGSDFSPVITINPTKRYQEMLGFGGALTESSAWVLAQLPADKRAEILRRYYDPREGIGYTLARTHMNSCDFSLNIWSLDDTPGDYYLRDFSLDRMRKWMLPLIREARDIAGPANFKLFVAPWSPPAWMKTNNRMDDGGKLRPAYRGAWADFFVRFAQAMRDEEHIPVWMFNIQNEPEAHTTWENCLYTAEEERDFARDYLIPALKKAGFLDGPDAIKLLGWDHNRNHVEERANALFGDRVTAKYIWGLGLHWYDGWDYAVSSRVHEKYPDKHIIFTESAKVGNDTIGSWGNAEGYAISMFGDFKNWVVGHIDWNIALDQRGGPDHLGSSCDAAVIVNTDTKEIRYTPIFYYMAHFSRFVKPGARRIETTGGPKNLQSIAFINPDGTLALIVFNKTDTAETFDVKTPTDAVSLTSSIPAHAIQTYLLTNQ